MQAGSHVRVNRSKCRLKITFRTHFGGEMKRFSKPTKRHRPPGRFSPGLIVLSLVLLNLALLACVGLAFLLRPQLSQLLAGRRLPPACEGPSLTIREASFPIQDLLRAADGSLPFPEDSQDVAYRVQPVGPQLLLALSPNDEHLLLAASLMAGESARITREDCSGEVFAITAVTPANWSAPETLGSPSAGLVIFAQGDQSGVGFAIQGELIMALAAPTEPVREAELQVTAQQVTAQGAVLPAPTFQPPECGSAKLTLGGVEFAIQPITAPADGSPLISPDLPGVAYWLEGTETHPVFSLGPTSENLALVSALQAGQQASLQWANCNAASYTLLAPGPGLSWETAVHDPAAAGIFIFIPSGGTTMGLTVRGELAEEVLSAIAAPSPGSGEVQAEISLLETALSADGQTLQVELAIYNYGGETFRIAVVDISLAAAGSQPVAPVRSKPFLPERVTPGETKNFRLTFPRPASSPATLRVFQVEYELEF